MPTVAPPPLQTSLVDAPRGQRLAITRVWYLWLLSLAGAVEQVAGIEDTVALSGQGASIGATAFDLSGTPAGLYRVSWYARITTAAVTSSSLTVTVAWTDGGVSCTTSGAAMTGNTTNTVQSGSVLVRSDAAGPVTYATTYASNGAGEMRYRLDISVERIA